MSELLKEAVLEAKKLKEVAELDAKNRVIEAISPVIKKMIAEEVSGVDKAEFLFQEQDEQPLSGQPAAPAPVDPAATSPNPIPSTDPSIVPTVSPETNSALPITPTGGNMMDFPVPGPDGLILGFDQLFAMGNNSEPLNDISMATDTSGQVPPINPLEQTPEAPVTDLVPGEENPALPPDASLSTDASAQIPQQTPSIGESVAIDLFKKEIGLVAEKIGYVYFRKSVPSIVKENIKSKLFNLCEKLDLLEENCILNPKQARLVENKLNFLFQKLEEAETANIYEVIEGDTMSKRLEEFAAKLFEDETTPAGKTKYQTMKEDLLGENAPASSAFGDGKKASGAETESKDVHNPDALADEEGDNSILENAPASSAFGDGKKASGAQTASPDVHNPNALADEEGDNSILEINDTELQEAVRKLKRESILRKVKALRENASLDNTKADEEDTGLEKGAPKKKASEAHKTVDANNPKAKKPMVKECDMMDDDVSLMGDDDSLEVGDVDVSDDGEVELTFKIDIATLEKLLADAEDDGEVDINVADMASEEDDEDSDDDDTLEITDDEDSDEDDTLEIVDDEDSDEEEDSDEDSEDEDSDEDDDKNKILMDDESVKEKAWESVSRKNKMTKALKENAQKAIRVLEAQLVENQLLTAKALYLNKFSMREDLSRKQKQKIAEYLDRASTLTEAKETYSKIKSVLDESATTRKETGSSARSVSSGSSSMIKESVERENTVDVSRWATLAGIKKTK